MAFDWVKSFTELQRKTVFQDLETIPELLLCFLDVFSSVALYGTSQSNFLDLDRPAVPVPWVQVRHHTQVSDCITGHCNVMTAVAQYCYTGTV